MSAKPWDRGKHGWYIRLYANGKQSGRKVGPPGPKGEKLALDACEKINARDRRAAVWEPSTTQRPIPLDELLRGWLKTHGALRSDRTQATDRARIERLARFYGSKDLRDLTDEDCRRFAASVLEEGRSGDLAAGCLSTLRRVVNLAVKAKLIEASPVPEIGSIITQAQRRTRREARRTDAWTRKEAAEIQKLAARVGPRGLYVGISLALGTGARRGELLALRWEDVDLERSRIEFCRTATRKGGTKPPKSGKSRRTPIGPGLAALLAGELDRQRKAVLKGRPAPEWVVVSPTGRFWRERNFSRSWEALRRRFGTKARPLPFHATRHTFISWALADGRHPRKVGEWAGVSEAVIYSNYSHVLPDQEDDMGFADVTPHRRNR